MRSWSVLKNDEVFELHMLSNQALNEFSGGFILGVAGKIFLEFGKTDS